MQVNWTSLLVEAEGVQGKWSLWTVSVRVDDQCLPLVKLVFITAEVVNKRIVDGILSIVRRSCPAAFEFCLKVIQMLVYQFLPSIALQWCPKWQQYALVLELHRSKYRWPEFGKCYRWKRWRQHHKFQWLRQHQHWYLSRQCWCPQKSIGIEFGRGTRIWAE